MQTTVKTLKDHAIKVMSVLGKGHSERVYHKAMITSFNKKGILHRSEVIAPIYFMGDVVGFGRCDIIIDDLVVEFKANMKCPSSASSQLQKYLESLSGSDRKNYRGVIVNFNQKNGQVEILEERPIPTPRKKPDKSCKIPPEMDKLETLRYRPHRKGKH